MEMMKLAYEHPVTSFAFLVVIGVTVVIVVGLLAEAIAAFATRPKAPAKDK